MQFAGYYASDATYGALLPLASITVYLAGGTTLATLYTSTGAALANPLTADASGLYGFAAANGDYDVVVTPRGGAAQPSFKVYLDDPNDGSQSVSILWTAIATTTISASVNTFRTSGRHTVGLGACWATRMSSAPSGPAANYAQSSDGAWWRISDNRITPEMLGACYNGSQPASGFYSTLAALQADFSFATSLYQEMDWLALQFALYSGSPVDGAAQQTYKLYNANAASQTAPLTAIAGLSWFDGNECKLDATSLAFQTSSGQSLSDPTFSISGGSSPWYNATRYTSINNAVFGSGAAVITDNTSISFSQFWQQVTLGPGKYQATLTTGISLGHSYSTGNTQPPYGSIGFFTSADGIGQILGSAQTVDVTAEIIANPTTTFTQTVTCSFELTVSTAMYVTWTSGGYGNFSISPFEIIQWTPNCAILLTRDGQAEHYPTPSRFKGFELDGPAAGSTGLRGVVYKSFISQDGTLVKLDDATISTFGDGIAYEDGAYLTEHDNVNVIGNGRGVVFEGGTFNSGENFRWKGGGIFNNTITGIDNPGGAELTLYGTALDYNTQAITNNAGRIELHGCHQEMDVPTASGKPLFHCISSGRITRFGGMFLGAGTVGSAASGIIQLDGFLSSVVDYGVELYGMATNLTAGVYPVMGLGTYRQYGWRNAGNPNVSTGLLSQNPGMDVYGGMGCFPSISGAPFNQLSADDIHIGGGCYPYNTTSGSLYAMNDRWNATSTGSPAGQPMTAVLSTDYAPPTVPIFQTYSTNYPSATWNRALKVVRQYGVGAANKMVIVFPVSTGQDFLIQFSWLAPSTSDTDGGSTNPMYTRLFWAMVTGYDSVGRPIFGTQNYYLAEQDITIPKAGITTWTTWSNRSTYGSPSAPAWATHAALVFDMQSLPIQTLYFANFIAPPLG